MFSVFKLALSQRVPTGMLGLLMLSTALATGCSPGNGAKGATTTAVPATLAPVPTTEAPTTTTVAVPVAPQSSASGAADALIHNWEVNNEAVALRVATPTAVAALFAKPYAGQTVVDRNCSLQYPPTVCSYGPPGGGNGNLYQIYLTRVGSLWYVSSVTVEG